MVKETNLDGKIVYTCEKCGWMYRDNKIAVNCQKWCEKHKTCNLNYQKQAIRVWEMKNEKTETNN
ncbi:MAG: hypothetical protein AABW49_03340 [Nanoarchaeota archaeon]